MNELKTHLSEVERERSASEVREKESLEKLKKLSGDIRSKEREVREAKLKIEDQADVLLKAKTSEDHLTKRLQQARMAYLMLINCHASVCMCRTVGLYLLPLLICQLISQSVSHSIIYTSLVC